MKYIQQKKKEEKKSIPTKKNLSQNIQFILTQGCDGVRCWFWLLIIVRKNFRIRMIVNASLGVCVLSNVKPLCASYVQAVFYHTLSHYNLSKIYNPQMSFLLFPIYNIPCPLFIMFRDHHHHPLVTVRIFTFNFPQCINNIICEVYLYNSYKYIRRKPLRFSI